MVKAFVTLLYSSSYLPGALVLGHSLKQLGLPLDTELVVLLATQLTPFEQNLLEEVYDTVLETSLIHAPNSPQLALLGRAELKPTFSKAQLFALTQYEKIIYLDSDVLPLQKIDSLFELDLRVDQIAASPDSGWPDIFNSGVMVLRPDLDIYGSLLERSQTENCSFDGADQGLFNQFFNIGKPDGWIRLPFLFNVTPSGKYQYDPAFAFFNSEVKVIHYIGSIKPWSSPGDLGAMRDKWWVKYEEFFGQDKDVKRTIHGLEPRYYVSEPIFDEQEAVAAEEEEEDLASTDAAANDDQEVLLNPQSYQYFETAQTAHPWDPAYEPPPKNGAPEASHFPTNLHYYNQWDEVEEDTEKEIEEALEEEALEEEYSAPEPEWTAPSVFPWEYENRRTIPERVFDNAGSFTFDNPWENLPLIQKIKEFKIEESRAQNETVKDEDEISRLKEIEDRYTGTIEEQEIKDLVTQSEADEEAIVKADGSDDELIEEAERETERSAR